jgi:hypothetical protein
LSHFSRKARGTLKAFNFRFRRNVTSPIEPLLLR